MSDVHEQAFDVHEARDVTVVRFRAKVILDELAVQAMAEQLFRLVDQSPRKKLLLNFEQVEYLSSAALGKLINLHKHLTSKGGRLSFCNVIPQIYEVFAITKLDKLFKTEPYTDEDDPDADLSGVPARLKPPKPTGGASVSLKQPEPDGE
jgi:anti-sigma B factor antagonist